MEANFKAESYQLLFDTVKVKPEVLKLIGFCVKKTKRVDVELKIKKRDGDTWVDVPLVPI
jgi:hypothetical protein